MAKYQKRKDGRYCTHVDTGTYAPDGKRIRVTVYARTIKELEEKISKIRHATMTGTYTLDSNITVREYADLWLNSKKSLANSTFNGYKNIIDNHISLIGNIPISKLLKSDVIECIDSLNGHYDLQQRLKITLNQILNAAIDDNLIYKNVCAQIRLPHKNTVSTKRPLSEREKQAIKECDFSLREKAFVYLLYFTGIRRGEALALSRQDIDFKTNELTINKAVAFINNNQPIIKSPKTQYANRTIPMPDVLVETLKAYIDTIDTIYLFTRQNGKIMSEGSYKRMWNSIYTKINTSMGGSNSIKATDLTVHMFRHNYATLLYYQGIDVKQAQKLLGHSNIKTTLEIYTHFIDDEKVKSTLSALAI